MGKNTYLWPARNERTFLLCKKRTFLLCSHKPWFPLEIYPNRCYNTYMVSNALVSYSSAVGRPSSSLGAYLSEIGRHPLLSVKEEVVLLRRVSKDNDRESAQKLILSNLRFVVHIAKTYQGYGLPLADLIQEGNIGLMKSIKRFDAKHGVRLITFAAHWIRAEIHEFIIKNWRLVKIATTKAQRKLFYKLRSMKKTSTWFTETEVKAISNDLKVKPSEVRVMEQRMAGSDVSIENDNEDEESNTGLIHSLASNEKYQPEYIAEAENDLSTKKELLNNAMNSLDGRSKKIIDFRYGEEKQTLSFIAKKLNISIERVRQLEEQALAKLRHTVSS